MLHSTLTSKGQTTIPREVRAALQIEPGDRLEYCVEGDRVSLRVKPKAVALKGALASDKGKGLPFAEIRSAAAAEARRSRAK